MILIYNFISLSIIGFLSLASSAQSKNITTYSNGENIDSHIKDFKSYEDHYYFLLVNFDSLGINNSLLRTNTN